MLRIQIFVSLAVLAVSQSYSQQGNDWTDTCASKTDSSGSSQSPIDLEVASGTCDNSMVLDIQFSKAAVQATMTRKESTIQTTALSPIGSLYATDINGDLFGYTAMEIVFRSPSEHTKEGERYDLEMQIIHKIKEEFVGSAKSTAIVSFLFQESDTAQPFFETHQFTLLQGTNTSSTGSSTTNTTNATNTASTTSKTVSINFNELLGAQIEQNPAYYTYQGSFTFPPCEENVNWYVLDQVFPIQSAQLTAFRTFYQSNNTFAAGNGNNRAQQDVGERTVKKGGVPCEEQFVYFFSFFILYIFINYFIFKLL